MVGRGVCASPEKSDCLILDCSDLVVAHGKPSAPLQFNLTGTPKKLKTKTREYKIKLREFVGYKTTLRSFVTSFRNLCRQLDSKRLGWVWYQLKDKFGEDVLERISYPARISGDYSDWEARARLIKKWVDGSLEVFSIRMHAPWA